MKTFNIRQETETSMTMNSFRIIMAAFLLSSAFPAIAERSGINLLKSDKVSTVAETPQSSSQGDVSAASSLDTDKLITESDATEQPITDTAATDKVTTGKWVLHAEQWELARSGDSILSLTPLNQLVKHWLKDRNKKIEIQYPGGEEGEFWVQELGDWLVALGIPSNQIFLLVGSGADDMIKFRLISSNIVTY